MSVQTTYNTDMAKAIEGQLAGLRYDVLSMVNAEAAAEIAFGRGVAFEGTDAHQAVLISDAADAAAGITAHSHAIAQSELGSTGVKVDGRLNVLRRGLIWVVCADAGGCSPGDRLWIAVADGTLLAANGGTDFDATSKGQWLTKASQDELALLDVDFTA